jgi:hypothetical protein
MRHAKTLRASTSDLAVTLRRLRESGVLRMFWRFHLPSFGRNAVYSHVVFAGIDRRETEKEIFYHG